MTGATYGLDLTGPELVALKDALVEVAMAADDDGNLGAFSRSPLRPVYDKVKLLLARSGA